MQKKNRNATKKKIVSAAWQLFYDQGYDETTVDDIIALSGTSKGSFYHYFAGKDALLSSLSFLFDEKYEELIPQLRPETDAFDKLMFLNQELFSMIESTVPLELLARMYSTQLGTKGEKHLLDRNRTYYKLLRQIILEGQEKGQLRTDMTCNDLTKAYAMCERALLYDWCICSGEYSLQTYTHQMLPLLLGYFRG